MVENDNYYSEPQMSETVTFKDWLITMLILCIPVVNIVMPFVWAFGSNSSPSKANFFKAQIIFTVAIIVLWFLFLGSLVSTIFYALS